jgi:hypothetical protein
MVDSAFHVVDLHPATVTFTLHGTRSPQSVSQSFTMRIRSCARLHSLDTFTAHVLHLP